MGAPERVFICESGQAPRVVRLGKPAPLLPSALPLLVFGGLLFLVLGWSGVDSPSPLLYVTAAAGFAALAAELVFIVRRHDALNPEEAVGGWLSRVRSALRTLEERKTVLDAMLRQAMDVLAPFCLVSLLYLVLQLWIDTHFRPAGAQRTVLWLEQSAITIRSLNPLSSFLLKIPKWADLGVTMVIALLAISAPALASLSKLWKTSSKWLERAYISVTLLSSVTFFGAHEARTVEAKSARWNHEIEQIRREYGDAREQVERDLTQVEAQEVVAQFPPMRDWSAGTKDLDSTDSVYNTSVREDVGLSPEIRASSVRLRSQAPLTEAAEHLSPEAVWRPTAEPPTEEANWSVRGAEDIKAEVAEAKGARGGLQPEFRSVEEKASDSLYSVLAENSSNAYSTGGGKFPLYVHAGEHEF